MLIFPKEISPARLRLAAIAEREAALQLAGDTRMAGPAIEKYLAVFREAMNRHGSTTQYSDLSVGYHWCCAFVYYCCQQAGLEFPPKPIADARCTLAAVPSWYEWASAGTFYHAVGSTEPQAGDIALYNRVYHDQPFDHIGVVIGSTPLGILSAEGNTANRTGLFEREFAKIAGFVRLPESLTTGNL